MSTGDTRLRACRARAIEAARPVFAAHWFDGEDFASEAAEAELTRIVDELFAMREEHGLSRIKFIGSMVRLGELRRRLSPGDTGDPTTFLRGGHAGLAEVAEAAAAVIVREFGRGAMFRGASANPR